MAWNWIFLDVYIVLCMRLRFKEKFFKHWGFWMKCQRVASSNSDVQLFSSPLIYRCIMWYIYRWYLCDLNLQVICILFLFGTVLILINIFRMYRKFLLRLKLLKFSIYFCWEIQFMLKFLHQSGISSSLGSINSIYTILNSKFIWKCKFNCN